MVQDGPRWSKGLQWSEHTRLARPTGHPLSTSRDPSHLSGLTSNFSSTPVVTLRISTISLPFVYLEHLETVGISTEHWHTCWQYDWPYEDEMMKRMMTIDDVQNEWGGKWMKMVEIHISHNHIIYLVCFFDVSDAAKSVEARPSTA